MLLKDNGTTPFIGFKKGIRILNTLKGAVPCYYHIGAGADLNQNYHGRKEQLVTLDDRYNLNSALY